MSHVSRVARDRPRVITAVVSIVGYALVVGAFAGLIPVPEIDRGTVIILSDIIAVVNAAALLSLLAGVSFIRRGHIRRHRAAMLTAFGLIMLFLVLYLTKVGGGFEKQIVIEESQFLATYAEVIRPVYITMLAIHVVLSVVAVPVVLHAIVLGLTHPPSELADTVHPRVGWIAVIAWTLSLSLGILTYILLNHVYSWDAMHQSVFVLLVAGPSFSRQQ